MYPGSEDQKEEDQELIDMVGKSPLTKNIEEDNVVDLKYKLFNYVRRLVDSACHLYTDDELGFDESLIELSKAILKLKGKEKQMMDEESKEDEKED
jgi:hypothetical protein